MRILSTIAVHRKLFTNKTKFNREIFIELLRLIQCYENNGITSWSSVTFTRNRSRSSSSTRSDWLYRATMNALANVRSNDGALYKALEVAVATSDFIAAPGRINPLASFHSVGSSVVERRRRSA